VVQGPALAVPARAVSDETCPAVDLVEEPSGTTSLWGVGCDAWYLAEDVVRVLAGGARTGAVYSQEPPVDTASMHLRDANGWAMQLPGLHRALRTCGTDPGHGVSPRERARAHRVVRYAGVRIPAWAGAHRGELRAGVFDGTRGGVGHASRGLERGQIISLSGHGGRRTRLIRMVRGHWGSVAKLLFRECWHL